MTNARVSALLLLQIERRAASALNGGSMSIDRKRIEAVRVLERLGYTYDGRSWQAPAKADLNATADLMKDLLESRAEVLAGCTEGSLEEMELTAIADVLADYRVARARG